MKTLLHNTKALSTIFLLIVLFFASESFGQTNTWTGGTSNWNTNGNWSLSHVPLAAEDVVIPNGAWTITVNTAAVCKSFALSSGNRATTVTISGGNSLTVTDGVTIGSGTGTGDNKILAVNAGSLSCASIDITATTNANRTSGVTLSTGTINVSGDITIGDANDDITFTGAGTLNVGGNFQSGATFTRSTGTVDYNGSGAQSIGAYTYNNLTTSTSGVKTLPTGSTINGTVKVQGTSTLLAGNTNLISNTAPVTLNGGTYSTGATTGFTEQVGVLTLTETSKIALGTGNHTLTFANSSGASWTSGKKITITGWVGGYNGTGASGTNPKIFVGTAATHLTSGQLNQIQFYNGTNNYAATLLSTGQLVPTATLVNGIGSFSPSPVCAGGTLSISGVGFTGVTAVRVNGVNVSSYTVNSSTSITAILSTSNTTGFVSVVTSGLGTYTSSSSLTVNPIPTSVSASASVYTICTGSTVDLTSSATPNSGAISVTLLDENFNATPVGWSTIANTGTGGTPSNADWTLRANSYANANETFNSNDASQFYLTDSDAQGSGSTTETILQAPAFSTVGLGSASLTFYHYYRYNSGTDDRGYVEVSTDGSSWTAIDTYSSTQGARNGFVQVTASLASYLGEATVYIRFRYTASWDWYWAIDNVAVTGVTAPSYATYAWTSTPSGYTSATQNPTGVAPTVATTYTVVVTNNYGCTASATTSSVSVNPRPTASVISGSAAICAGSTTNLQVAITGGTSPYTVVYSAGSVGSYTSGTNIPVTPSVTTNYTLTSVTDANGCLGVGNSGTAAVTIDLTTSTNGGVSWSNGTPVAGKSAVFDGSTATLGADFTACSLRLKNNAVVNVTSGFDITLTGAVAVETGSTLTLNNNANLLQSNSNYTNSGNVIVKRNSSALKRLDYTLWSTPVTGQGLYSFSPLTFGNRFYVYNTSTDTYSNSVGFSLTGLDANGVNGTDSNNVQFSQAKGYLIRMPWNHPTTPAVWNGTFTGVPNNGDVTFAMTTGYNAVGNPYPSRLNVKDFIDGNTNISGPLYLWRKTNDNTATSYATLTKTAYVANGAAGGDTGTGYFNTGNEANWVLNIGQGFIVNATSSTNLTFANSMRRSSNADQFFRTSETTTSANDGLYWLNLNTDTGIFSQMAVGYSSEGTLAEDRGIDGKNINLDFYLTSLIGTDEYSIQGRPEFQDADIVPLSYKVTTAGNYTITIDHTAGLFDGGSQSIYLKDNATTTIHNLNTAGYAFTTEAGTFNNRFEIVYQSQLSNPTFNANNVVIYSQNQDFIINSGNTTMASVKVFDVRGRLLQEKKDINANQTTIKGGSVNQVLLVQITSEDGVVVTKKVIR